MSIYNPILFYNNGNPKVEVSVKMKRGEVLSGPTNYLHAQTKTYYKSGKLQCIEERILSKAVYLSISAFDNGKRTGLFKYFFENGQIKIEGNFKNDLKVGVWKEYYENGQIKKSQIFFDHPNMLFPQVSLLEIKESIPIGLQKEWHPNGTLKRENKFRNIVLERDYRRISSRYKGIEIWDSTVQKWVLKYDFESGDQIACSHDDLDVHVITPIMRLNKLFHDHPNHHIIRKKGWTKDGILLFEHHYRWNKKEKKINLHGTSKEYDGYAAIHYKKQVLKYKRNYRNGKLHGIQEAYHVHWPDGVLKERPSFKTKIKNGNHGQTFDKKKRIWIKNIEESNSREYWLSDGYYLSGKVVNEYESSNTTINLQKDSKSKTVKIVKIEPIKYNYFGREIREGFNDQRTRCIGDLYQKPENKIYVKEDKRRHQRYRNPNGLEIESYRFKEILEEPFGGYFRLFGNDDDGTKLKLNNFWFFEIDARGKRTKK